MEYDFNSSLYGSDGASVVSPQQQTMVAKADNSMLGGFLSLIGAGVTAYTTVKAAESPKKPKANDGSQPGKIAAPVIATTAPKAGALSTKAKALIGGGVAVVLLLVGLLLFRRKK